MCVGCEQVINGMFCQTAGNQCLQEGYVISFDKWSLEGRPTDTERTRFKEGESYVIKRERERKNHFFVYTYNLP